MPATAESFKGTTFAQFSEWIEHVGADKAVNALTPLTPNEFNVIGTILQIFAALDYNARSTIQSASQTGQYEIDGLKLNDKDSRAHLLKVFHLKLPHDQYEMARASLNEIEEYSSLRHLAAHWYLKLSLQRKFGLFVSRNKTEGDRKIGVKDSASNFWYAVIDWNKFLDDCNRVQRDIILVTTLCCSIDWD